jgi:hypothetical protein
MRCGNEAQDYFLRPLDCFNATRFATTTIWVKPLNNFNAARLANSFKTMHARNNASLVALFSINMYN